MNAIIDKLIIFTCAVLLLIFTYPDIDISCVAAVLVALSYSCLASYLNPDFDTILKFRERPIFFILLFSYLGLSLLHPAFCLFLPVIFYDLLDTKFSFSYLLSIPICFLKFKQEMPLQIVLIFIMFALSYLLHNRSTHIYVLQKQMKELRDDSHEFNLKLSQKNKDLLEKQDYEIYLATLKERNRIAREIHDNVGHMLSRSILQMGALIAINKNETLSQPLYDLKDTLNLAMDSIRSSVHDLHDNSIDLKSTIENILNEYKQYEISFEYDMSSIVQQNVKYSFISIIKEALSNIVKHSNASKIHILLCEHPSFYQLMIEDNGSDIHRKDSGIGLDNMQERIHALHGSLSILTEQGFRIFISVPKSDS